MSELQHLLTILNSYLNLPQGHKIDVIPYTDGRKELVHLNEKNQPIHKFRTRRNKELIIFLEGMIESLEYKKSIDNS